MDQLRPEVIHTGNGIIAKNSTFCGLLCTLGGFSGGVVLVGSQFHSVVPLLLLLPLWFANAYTFSFTNHDLCLLLSSTSFHTANQVNCQIGTNCINTQKAKHGLNTLKLESVTCTRQERRQLGGGKLCEFFIKDQSLYVHWMILLLSNETTQWIESDHVLFLHWFSCRYNANHQPLILLFDLQTEGGNNSGLHSCPDAVNYCSYQTFRCLLIERASVSLSLPLLADNNYAWLAAFNCLCTNVT